MRDEVEAAAFYDQLAIKYSGHNAVLNFPEPHWEQMRALQIEARKQGDFGRASSRGGGSSTFRGVSKRRKLPTPKRGWIATITAGGTHEHLGSFSDEITAARAYDDAALRLHGVYVCMCVCVSVCVCVCECVCVCVCV